MTDFFSILATSGASAVPDSGLSALMLSMGILGLAATARFFKSKKK